MCLAVLCGPRAGAAGVLVAADDKAPAKIPDKIDEVVEEMFLGRVVYQQDALELQLTASLGGARAAGRTAAASELEVELGLTERLQLSAEAPLEWGTALPGERGAGLGNAAVGALYNPLSDRPRGMALSAGLEVTLPTASRSGAAAWGVEVFAVSYRALGRLHANLELGVELLQPTAPGAEREISPAGTLGVLAPIGRWVPVLEIRGELGAEPAAVASAGTLWHPIGGLELGAAIQLGLDTGPGLDGWSVGGLVSATVELELAGD
jgi:hypothetical protein